MAELNAALCLVTRANKPNPQSLRLYTASVYYLILKKNLRHNTLHVKMREMKVHTFISPSVEEVIAFCISWIQAGVVRGRGDPLPVLAAVVCEGTGKL